MHCIHVLVGHTPMTCDRGRRPVFARVYPTVVSLMDRELGERRGELLHGLAGQILEVGAGNGANFRHYPSAVTKVVAIEPEPRLRRLAALEARRHRTPIEVIAGQAEELPTPSGEFDGCVTSLVLCSVPNPRSALAEVARVLRPDGQYRALEHVQADGMLGALQTVADATIWPILAGGCHTHRDLVNDIRGSGFEIETIEEFRFPDNSLSIPTSPHVLVCARPS